MYTRRLSCRRWCACQVLSNPSDNLFAVFVFFSAQTRFSSPPVSLSGVRHRFESRRRAKRAVRQRQPDRLLLSRHAEAWWMFNYGSQCLCGTLLKLHVKKAQSTVVRVFAFLTCSFRNLSDASSPQNCSTINDRTSQTWLENRFHLNKRWTGANQVRMREPRLQGKEINVVFARMYWISVWFTCMWIVTIPVQLLSSHSYLCNLIQREMTRWGNKVHVLGDGRSGGFP